MLSHVLHRAARPLVQLWSRESSRSWRAMPVPTDAPLVHATGPDPDRILLVGSGPAISYGVLSYNLGLAGNLARQVSALTHHGAVVQAKVDSGMTIPDATAIVHADAGQYDAIVVVIGGLEAMSFFPSRSWRAQVDELFEASDTPVFLVGTAPLETFVRISRIWSVFTSRHTQRLNRQSEASCRLHGTATYVPFDPPKIDLATMAGRQTYADWAALISGPVARILARRTGTRTELAPVDEDARQRALDDLGIVESEPDYELQRIVETVRDLFAASGAAIHLIDRSRQWVMASVGMSTEDLPREQSLCNDTIKLGEMLVIENAESDPEYGTPEWLAHAGTTRFYAGFPLEAPDGHRIGALCIVDDKPRGFTTADRVLLRDLSLHVQRVLWQKQPN